MVPVLVVMGGTYAFSAWSGTANAFFGQSAATVSFTESISFNSTNAAMTPLSIDNGHHTFDNIVRGSAPFSVGKAAGGASATLNLYANVTNLVPGDWVSFTVMVNNTGTATLNVSHLYAGNAIINGKGDFYSNLIQISTLFPPISKSFLNGLVSGDIPGNIALFGPLTVVTASTSSNNPGYISGGQHVSYNVYIILPSNTPSYIAGCSSDLLEISLPISVAD